LDPAGQEIELLGDEEQRKKALEALRLAVGSKAGIYLTETRVKGTDRFVVGVTDAKAFAGSNAVAGEFAPIINAKKTVGLGVVSGSDKLPDGSTLSGSGTPGITGTFGGLPGIPIGGDLRVYVLDARQDYSQFTLRGDYMSNGLRSDAPDIGLVTAHELGHARARMTGGPFLSREASNGAALRLENKVRVLRDPKAANRKVH
jgi:hypothetical protein